MKSFFTTCVLAAIASAAPEEELMGQLPLTSAFDTKTYSGFAQVSDTKKLHYVFAESMNDPANDPVLMWFSGGPGCSSMLGFMQENGPRVINDGEDFLVENPHTWNTRANVLWLESPAGVGWSVGSEADLTTNDEQSSVDALAALQAWYAKYPEYKGNELFISGESYAGVYVPYLAYQIDLNNRKAEYAPQFESINLKGYLVGNGCTDWQYDESADVATYANFNVIPQSLWQEY